MINKVILDTSTQNCVNKILYLKKSAISGEYTLLAIDKHKKIPRGTIAKIAKISEILNKAKGVEDKGGCLKTVSDRINSATDKHNKLVRKNVFRLFLKAILPKILFERLRLPCLMEYKGVDSGSLASKKRLEDFFQNLKTLLDPSDINKSLDETVESLLAKYWVTAKDIQKEAFLLNVDESEAKRKMAKRLAIYLKAGIGPMTNTLSLARRQEATGYEISILKGIEKIFKKHVLSNEKSTTAPLEGHPFTVIASGKNVIVEEKKAGEGSFKIVTFASDYFAMKNPSERGRYVTLKLIPEGKPKAVDKAKESNSSDPSGEEISDEDKEYVAALANTLLNEGDFSKLEAFLADVPESEEPDQKLSPNAIKNPVVIHTSSDFKGSLPKTSSISQMPKESLEEILGDGTGSIVIYDTPSKQSLEALLASGNGSVVIKGQSVDVQSFKKIAKKAKTPLAEVMSYFVYDYNDPANFAGMPYTKWLRGALERELEDVNHKLKQGMIPLEKIVYMMDKQEDLAAEIAQRQANKEVLDAYVPLDEKQEFNHEAKITKLFQGKGVVKLHSIVDLASGDQVIVEEAAGYKLKAKGKEEGMIEDVTAIDLKMLAKLHKKGKLSKEQKLTLFSMLDDAFAGIERMHNMGYIHRDLKPENILATKDGKGALSDFGTVCKIEGDHAKSAYLGTPGYSAPELCAYSGNDRWTYIDEKSDVWSAGLILMECCFEGCSKNSHPAINGTNPEAIREYLRELTDRPKYKEMYDFKYKEPADKDSLEHLVWHATRVEPERRPTMAEFRKKFNIARKALEKSN